MKVSYSWLNHHLRDHADKSGATPYTLPSPEKIAELLIFNALDVESIEKIGNDHVLDVKVTPNRAHDCFSHQGIARELARLLGRPLYPETLSEYEVRSDKEVHIEIREEKRCPRYMAVVIEGVKVGPSPAWLRERLESVGQRSVNNVVDVTNFVMLETGQPLHAFDLDKLATDAAGNPRILVRAAIAGEKLTTLDDKPLELSEGMLVIADEREAIAVAGVKGGKSASIGEGTVNIVIESANFDGTSVRKTSRALSLRTDSSARFEHGISAELAEEGIRLAIELILKVAGTDATAVGSIADAYPKKRQPYKFGVSVSEVNGLLGTKLSEKEVGEILKRLGFEYEKVDPLAKVLELAPRFEGVPYKYGASISYDAPAAFDCSSFTAYLYAQAGIGLPRMAVDQYCYGAEVKKKDLKQGDLVFSNTGSGKIYFESKEFMPGRIKVSQGVDHVGLYLGNGMVAHATRTAGKVAVEPLEGSVQFKDVVGYRRFAGKERRFVVTTPAERLDLMAARSFLVSGIKEDLIEEIGRIYGYRNIKAVKPKPPKKKPMNNPVFDKANAVRVALVGEGYSEVMTYAFRSKGDVELANPISSDKKFLRSNLSDGIKEAVLLNKHNAALLGLSEIKIFEIGSVFGQEEKINVALGEKGGVTEYSLEEAYEKFAQSVAGKIKSGTKNIKYKTISPYPFALRDIAVFVPKGVKSDAVLKVITGECGALLVQKRLFDVFEKEGRISYAFNLVFQSSERTLIDEELNAVMAKVTAALNSKKGWQVR